MFFVSREQNVSVTPLVMSKEVVKHTNLNTLNTKVNKLEKKLSDRST